MSVPADSPCTPSEHVQSGREALDKLVEGLDTVRVEHARAYREVCDSLAALVALAERQRDASLALIGNAVLNQDAFDDNVSVTIQITEWRAFTSAVLAGGAGDE